MIEEKIRELREELNEKVLQKKDFDEIYETSLELDNLIIEYYRKNEGDNWKEL